MAARPPSVTKVAGPGYEIHVVGAAKTPLRDAYHALMRWPWWVTVAVIVSAYLALNVLFASLYLAVGGVANVRPGSFGDAFYFATQGFGAVGSGAYPTGTAAHALSVTESIAVLLLTAVSTGLLFAKFSQTNARIVFTRQVVITPMDGVPTLMFRLGNERSNRIIEAQIRAVLMRTEQTAEGARMYRMHDLQLSRDRSPALSRSWTALHPITPGSPLYGQTPESLVASETELMVTVVGTDDTSLTPVHAQKHYLHTDVQWGARHVDILTEEPNGDLTLDLRRFHDVMPTEPTPAFPYPKPSPVAAVAEAPPEAEAKTG
jgi:inward rectifier potassium channel